MRLYYLGQPISSDDLARVREALETEVDQVAIPYVLPAPDGAGFYPDRPWLDDTAAGRALQAAGIARDIDQRVALVAPADVHWYVGFSQAIFTLTGHYPFVVQTAQYRESTSEPGETRIFDLHARMMRE